MVDEVLPRAVHVVRHEVDEIGVFVDIGDIVTCKQRILILSGSRSAFKLF